MKKGKLSISLVTGFIGALALTACGEVTEKAGTIVTFKGYDGSTIEVKTDDVYADYRSSSTGISTYYNSILETLVRYQYSDADYISSLEDVKSYNEVVDLAEKKVLSDKTTAESTASSSGTSYQEEWEKILSAKGCEDEAELREYYIYSIEKEQLTDWLFNYEPNKQGLTQEYIGLNEDYEPVESKASSQYPYHIRHILVKISGTDTDYIQSTIEPKEITKLYSVVSKLTDTNFGYLFADVAKSDSEDNGDGNGGSAANGGDVGIITPSSSFVNEFKLGIYAFDAILSGKNTNNTETESVYNGLGFGGTIKNTLKNDGTVGNETVENLLKKQTVAGTYDYLTEVPYAVFNKLNEWKDVTTDVSGDNVNDGETVYYPRNILFNQYLNFHNPFVITNESIKKEDTGDTQDWPSGLEADNPRFQSIDGTAEGKKVLCDELGRVIIGVRGTYGIHFMVMEKSIFEATNTLKADNITIKNTTDADKAKIVAKYSTNLEDYYSTYIPTDKDFPKNPVSAQESIQAITYVNADEANGKKDYYSGRATEVKDAIKGFDSTYDYRLYEKLIDDIENGGSEIKYQGSLKEDIENYIESQRATNKTSSKTDLSSKWREYIELLQEQTKVRTDGKKSNKLVPTECAVSFSTKNSEKGSKWDKGGVCHNAK